MNDPWTRTTVWGLTGGGQRGETWDNCNRITIKMIKKEKEILKIILKF